jgi:hypothetical protein
MLWGLGRAGYDLRSRVEKFGEQVALGPVAVIDHPLIGSTVESSLDGGVGF